MRCLLPLNFWGHLCDLFLLFYFSFSLVWFMDPDKSLNFYNAFLFAKNATNNIIFEFMNYRKEHICKGKIFIFSPFTVRCFSSNCGAPKATLKCKVGFNYWIKNAPFMFNGFRTKVPALRSNCKFYNVFLFYNLQNLFLCSFHSVVYFIIMVLQSFVRYQCLRDIFFYGQYIFIQWFMHTFYLMDRTFFAWIHISFLNKQNYSRLKFC